MKKPELSFINSTIASARKLKNDIAIIVVANVNANNDYHAHSLKTEFFAENEYEEIITGFRENGFYVVLQRNEMDFFRWYLNDGIKEIGKKYIAVYNAASGGNGPGKKSLIPAFCNLNKIPITSSNPYVVGLCRHKYHINCLLQNHGLPVPKSSYFSKDFSWLLDKRPEIGNKIIAKPTYESASIGVDDSSVFNYSKESDKILYNLSETFNQPTIVQEFVSGYEIEVPIIVKKGIPYAVNVIGLGLDNVKLLNDRILTYDIVYKDNYSFYDFNEFGESFNQTLLTAAKSVAQIIGIEGFGRVDFRITHEQDYYVMDVSTYPHIIHHSSFWYMLDRLNFQYHDLFALMVGLTGERYNWQ